MFLRVFALSLALVATVASPSAQAWAQGAALPSGQAGALAGGTAPAPPASPAATGPQSPATAATATPLASGPGVPVPVGQDYKLGTGDKIRIMVYGEPALSGEFFVSSTGKVSFPLVGDIQAASLSVQAFQQEIETALRQGYLKEPRVSAEVLTYRPYYILGEVNKPGEYPYSSGLNVLNAVATAGGFTYRAQKKNVKIRRANETAEQTYPLTGDLGVSPGDTIRVTERIF